MPLLLGIGIVVHNRRTALNETLDRLLCHTRGFEGWRASHAARGDAQRFHADGTPGHSSEDRSQIVSPLRRKRSF
jgi:hypothetical protein